MPMLFVNLPVRDLATARAFYTALGYSLHEPFSDEQTAALSVTADIALLLHTRDRFAELVPGEVGDPARATTVVLRLTADSREDVDELVATALGAGGRPWQPAKDGGASYTGSFTDPDGNAWEISWLDSLHTI
jgi:predicted lactoylglutathione lyase